MIFSKIIMYDWALKRQLGIDLILLGSKFFQIVSARDLIFNNFGGKNLYSSFLKKYCTMFTFFNMAPFQKKCCNHFHDVWKSSSTVLKDFAKMEDSKNISMLFRE